MNTASSAGVGRKSVSTALAGSMVSGLNKEVRGQQR